MKYKVAIIATQPINVKHWPFDNISISILDRTYIVVKGITSNIKEVLADITRLVPSNIEGMAVTIERESKITIH